MGTIRTSAFAAPPSPTGAIGESALERIGNTPLLRIAKLAVIAEFPNAEFYAKAEWFNPGGSVKDRAALAMILDGERSGKLRAGHTILDATSGNTGIAYAFIGAAKGYRVKLCLPANASVERQRILAAYGAELILTPADQGSDGAIRRVREIYAAEPARYFYPDQYSNPANWRAHYNTTACEIWQQTVGRITHFVAGLGTSGTFIGIARRLEQLNPAIQTISFQPDCAFHGLEGMKHMSSSIVPKIYDPGVADRDIAVRTEEAHAMVRALARQEGLLVGISSGAAMQACVDIARELPPREPAVFVTVFPDSGDKYLSERFWEEDDQSASRDETGPSGIG